ncbi:MAG TPA: hypothetical protein G4O12_04115 [Dehalococcoidia bacterium]|nr:hypothetical protein [Dehalococcoidia bacterium]
MKTLKATLINASMIDLVHNLWELTLIIEDDPANVRKYTVRSKYPFKDSEIRRFQVVLKGNEVVQIEPLEEWKAEDPRY